MARRYHFKAADGSSVIPVADGEYFTDTMSVTPDEADVYISFYSDAEATTPQSPSTGQIDVHGEYTDGFFLEAVDGRINANSVSPDATFTPSQIDGCSVRARITLSNVNANFMKAFVYKRGG